MPILVSELHYFAPVIFYYKLSETKHCIFDQYEHFQKMGFRNRCIIAGAGGPLMLTIPLEGGRNQKAMMKDVRIRNAERWQENHWRSITSAYNKSPWFEFYRHELEELYATRFSFLVDWDMRCFEWTCDKLSLKVEAQLTPEFRKNYPEEKYEDLRNGFRPATINQLYPAPPHYPQVFEERNGFLPNLSILDYLFCAGNKLTRTG